MVTIKGVYYEKNISAGEILENSNNPDIFKFFTRTSKTPENNISQSEFWSENVKAGMFSCLEDLGLSAYNWSVLVDNLEALKSSQSHLLGLIKYYEGDGKHYYESFTSRYRDLNGRGTLTGGFGSTRKTNIKTNEDGYKQLQSDLLLHGKEVIKKVGGNENWKKIPISIREALVDLAFNKGLHEINKTVILNAISNSDWSSIIPTLKEVKNNDGKEEAGLYRRSLSRAILALRDLKGKELKQAKTQVAKMYEEAVEFYNAKNINTRDLADIWNVYNQNDSQVKIKSAQSFKHEVKNGETYWAIAKKYCPEGEKINDFINVIKSYNLVPKDKDILEVERLINIPLEFNGKSVNAEKKLNVIQASTQQNQSAKATETQIVGQFIISGETESFSIGEKYSGKGFFAVAKDIYAKYTTPGFTITELSNKIQQLNSDVEFKVGVEIKIPKIVETKNVSGAKPSNEVIDNEEERKDYDENGTPVFKRMLESGMPYEIVDKGAKDKNLKLLTFTYKVEQGEGFYALAEKFDIDWRTLKDFNQLQDISSLTLGQEIKIPKIVYEVQPQDNLYKIQEKFQISKELLIAMNDIESPNTIQEGAKFALPGYIYTVKLRDNLSNIARNAGISLDVLKNINGLKSNVIIPGQNLVILFNDMDYNVSSDRKITKIDRETKEVQRKQVNTATISTKNRKYFTRDTDKNGNTIATRHVFLPTNNSENAPLHGETIIVNAGHGYKPGVTDPDPGALGQGGLEHECYIAYDNAMWLKDELNKLGARVIFIQGFEGKASKGLNLASKEAAKTRNKANYLVSLHVNMGKPKANRMEIFYNKETGAGKNLAEKFEDRLENSNKYSEEFVKVKPMNYQILKNAKQPAILYEMGFMDHADGRKYLRNQSAQKKNMSLLALAIVDCVNEEKKYKKYTVKSGDTLSEIALKNNTSVEALRKLNGLSGNNIRVKQVLKLPN